MPGLGPKMGRHGNENGILRRHEPATALDGALDQHIISAVVGHISSARRGQHRSVRVGE